jgi:hypothetical protein
MMPFAFCCVNLKFRMLKSKLNYHPMYVENLFTYGLLLYYGLDEEKAKQYEEVFEKFKHLNVRTFHGKYINEFKKQGWPDIVTFIEDPKYIVDYANYYIKQWEEWLYCGFFETKKHIENNINSDLNNSSISWISISDAIKSNLTQKYLYYSIASSYKDLPLHIKALQIGSEDFDEALIRFKNTGSSPIKSKTTLKDLRNHFKEQLKKYYPVHKEVFENLPLKVLKDIPNITQKRVSQYFKKQLAIKLESLFFAEDFSYDEKYIAIGTCLVIGGYSLEYQKFVEEKLPKKGVKLIVENGYFDKYREYLRDESRNVLK